MLVQADARALPLAARSVQCVITSPPYWGLRDYGTAEWSGGDPTCDHSPDKRGGRFATPVSDKQASNPGSGTMSVRDCPCGALRVDQQIGMEPTPDAYVDALCTVFQEVWRVLKDDGTLWLNLGDSYAGGGTAGSAQAFKGLQGKNRGSRAMIGRPLAHQLKPKDLVGIPWRVAFALQAAGWYLRSDIIWHKPNPMPESITDRPTKSHEYLFLLSKSARYVYDGDAIREEDLGIVRPAFDGTVGLLPKGSYQGVDRCGNHPNGRNKRSVWTINTEPYTGAHFATFPTALVEPCVLAGSRPGDVILDPFCGSGTVGAVACWLRGPRRFVGCDLSPAYLQLARQRLTQAPLFADTGPPVWQQPDLF